MNQFGQLDQLIEEHGGTIQTFQVLEAGISKPAFYAYVKEKGLEQARMAFTFHRMPGQMPCICCIYGAGRLYSPMKARCFSMT